MNVLAFDKQKRDAIDEADDVGAAAIQFAFHPQFAHRQEVVVLRRLEIEHAQGARVHRAVVLAESDLHPVAQLAVFLAVGGHAALPHADLHDLAQRILIGHQRQVWIQRHEPFAQNAGQHHILFADAAEAAFRPQHLGVVGVFRPPTQHIAQIVGRGLLDQGVFVQRHVRQTSLRLQRSLAGRMG